MCKCLLVCTCARHVGSSEDSGVAHVQGKEALARRLGLWVLTALKGGLRTGLILTALGAWGSGVKRGLREAHPVPPGNASGGGGGEEGFAWVAWRD